MKLSTQPIQEFNLFEHVWRDLKMAVHKQSPSNLTELERICGVEWQKIPKSRCAELDTFHSRGKPTKCVF